MLWTGGGANFVPLPAGYSFGRAHAVNSAGAVAGVMELPGFSLQRAFIFSDGVSTDIGIPPGAGPPNHNHVELNAMNASGTLVGMTANLVSGPLRAFRWERGAFTLLDLPIGPNAHAYAINDRGMIGGWVGDFSGPSNFSSPFIWHDGRTAILPLPPDAAPNPGARVTGLNNRGDACGHYFRFDRRTKQHILEGCAWIDGKVINIGHLPGYSGTRPFDINDAREIVGEAEGAISSRGFLWRDGVMHDLNTLVPPGSPRIDTAAAINNRGQITGSANPSTGGGIAFLLTPALPATPGDVNCDSTVNVTDLLAVISAWDSQGPVGGRPADLNRDNKIDAHDLIETILNWG